MRKLFPVLFFLTLLSLALLPLSTQAVNLQINSVSFHLDSAGRAYIQSNVSWGRSWRDSVNWDAAWVFVKFRQTSGPGAPGVWRTATLSSLDADHIIDTGGAVNAAVNAAADGKGVMVYHRLPWLALGIMNLNLGLRWNYQADGVNAGCLSCYEIKVFAIEMVYIPRMAFRINPDTTQVLTNEFASINGSLSRITSEAPLPTGAIRWVDDTGAGGTGHDITVNGITYPGSDSLGAAYPKGYAASYCMKYEVTQGQYTDFLNCLTRAQQIRRVPVDISGDSPAGGKVYVMAETDNTAAAFRNTITCPAIGMGTTQPIVFSCDRPDRAANYLIWADAAAYLDWAGLRPMSELEFEKICRGPLAVVPNELAGGSAAATAAVNINGPENGTETTDPAANYSFGFQNYVGGDGGNGPLRAGIFATNNTNREQAGATYYGVMDMSGNCWERCVTVAAFDLGQPTNAGRFDGTRHGDGQLDSLGNHNVPTWPNSTDVRGSNFRGGNWSRPAAWAAVSDRQYGGQAISGRTSHRGIRGVRSAASFTSPPHGSGGSDPTPMKYQGGPYDGYASLGLQIALGGLPEAASHRQLVAFPNPTADATTLQVRNGQLTNATLTLTDALGRPVRHLTNLSGTTVRLDRADLAPGLYFYHVADQTGLIGTGRLLFR